MISTTALLTSSSTYTSPTQTVGLNEARITGTVLADQLGTLYIEQSGDAANWDVSTQYSILVNIGHGFTEDIVAPYWRLRYVNGNTNQGVFRLYAKARL